MPIKHLHVAATTEDFLNKMGDMYAGRRPLSRDCRSTVVKYLKAHPEVHGQIYVYGFQDSLDVVHVLLVDDHARVVADAYNGRIAGNKYLVDLPSGPAQILDRVKVLDVSHFLSTYC